MVTFLKTETYDLSKAKRKLPWEGISTWAVHEEDVPKVKGIYPELEEYTPPDGYIPTAIPFENADYYVCKDKIEEGDERFIFPEKFREEYHCLEVEYGDSGYEVYDEGTGYWEQEKVISRVTSKYQILFLTPEKFQEIKKQEKEFHQKREEEEDG